MERETFEGIWEEILLYSPELTGRRVRLTVLPDEAAQPGTGESLDQVLKGRVGRVQFQPASLSEHTKEAFSDLLAEKYRYTDGFRRCLSGRYC